MATTSTTAGRSAAFSRRAFLTILGVLIGAVLAFRLGQTIYDQVWGPEVWIRNLINGLALGAVYALIALGYTLVYGILFMINFAHGEVLMLGAMAGFFVLDASINSGFLDYNTFLTIVIVFIAGMSAAVLVGVLLERIAYRPLRGAPRLVPLISAIGASIFLQNAALQAFGANVKIYPTPRITGLSGGQRFGEVFVANTSIMIMVLAIITMVALVLLVNRSRFGKAMRAVAEDKPTAQLMGIDVNRIILLTFALGSLLAGMAGVMLGFHNRQVTHMVGFMPGLKAFTAAVLGGIGNVPGAMMGGFFLGLPESLGPTAFQIPSAYKDVIAFGLLVLILIFRPTGLMGERLSRERA